MSLILRQEDAGLAVEDACSSTNDIDRIGFRVGGIFIVLTTSILGTMIPLVTRRVPALRRLVPGSVFEACKYFGSGVILSTAFIHLLEPAASEALNPDHIRSEGGCLPDGWGKYPFAFAIFLTSLFVTFVLELFAYRMGSGRLANLGIGADSPLCTRGRCGPDITENYNDAEEQKKITDDNSSTASSACWRDSSEAMPASAQIVGLAVLESGIIFHSVIIGMTLALSTDDFNQLLVVLTFHQAFEGLGLGARLTFLRLPSTLGWVPFTCAFVYASATPLGMVIGLAARSSVNMSSSSATIVEGVLDSISAGILAYSACVQLIAQEFILNNYWQTAPIGRVVFALVCFATGAAIMSILALWA